MKLTLGKLNAELAKLKKEQDELRELFHQMLRLVLNREADGDASAIGDTAEEKSVEEMEALGEVVCRYKPRKPIGFR